MQSFEASISVAAPRESVWLVLADVVAWPEWLPTVASVEPHDGNALKVGFRYTVRQPKLRPATWIVTHLEAPHRFVWQARSPGLLMTAEHTVQQSSGASQVTLRFSFQGLLGAAVSWLFGSVTQRYLSQETASLKLKVEGRQQ